MKIRDQLVMKALCALDEAAEAANAGPVAPSFALRFALAYLFAVGKGERWMHDAFWREMQVPDPADGRMSHRGTQVYSCLQGVMRNAGIVPTVETLGDLRRRRDAMSPEAISRRRLAKVIQDEAALRAERDGARRKGKDCGWL